jgi:predicted O-methyltransferase YrrM
VADNVVRGGAVVDADDADPRVVGVRRLVEAIAAEPRLVAAGVQTVGVKGWDGMVLALVV